MTSLNKSKEQCSLLRLDKGIFSVGGARGACDWRKMGPNLLRFAEVINTSHDFSLNKPF